jgi:hypothetical protein
MSGNELAISIAAPADEGCTVYVPGLLFTVGFSNNTAPSPVSISVQWTGEDGCPGSCDDIRVSLTTQTQGKLALLFNCNEQQRLYPVIAVLRNNVPFLPTGTVLPGVGTTTAPINYPNSTIEVQVTGPAQTSITVETLAWNQPALGCLWTRALSGLGL